ncbi:MAG: lysophospholipid acyltransferase family protein [Bacteroidales bacterium]|nr:lysophospholipid acyltransferase family protein [Bacteroidales bacterium]
MRILRKILSWTLYAFMFVLSLLPLRVHYLFSDFICWLLHSVLKYRRKVVDINLRSTFKDLPEAELKQVTREYYRYISDVICESVWAISKSSEKLVKKGIATLDNKEVLAEVYEKYGNVILLMPHTGNWEFITGLPVFAGIPGFDYENLAAAYQPLSSQVFDDIFKRIRSVRMENRGYLLSSDKILRFVLEHKTDKRVYIFISDQYPYKNAAVETSFLGLPTLWVNGGEAIARKLKLPVLYIYVDRVSRGNYHFRLTLLSEHPELSAPGEIMTMYSDLLDKDIRDNIHNWLWSHKRWKNIENLY